MRSGRVKSSTAAPSLRNSGLETTEKVGMGDWDGDWIPAFAGMTEGAGMTGKAGMTALMLVILGLVPGIHDFQGPWIPAFAGMTGRRPASTLRSITSFRPGS